MKINARLHAAELAIGRVWNHERVLAVSVCDRIDELTVFYAEHPPTLPPATEAGILAAVEREMLAERESS